MMLSEREMLGQLPIFVDAFPSSSRSEVYAILNFSPLFGTTALPTSPAWKKWTGAEWDCKWASKSKSPQLSRLSSEHIFDLVTRATVLHSTLDPDDETPHTAVASTEAEMFRWFHHAMVLSCPSPPPHSGSDSVWYLTLSARQPHAAGQAGILYERSSIPIPDKTFVQPGSGPILCTMVFQEPGVTSILRPWVQFHLTMGFDQILLYVEDAHAAWASDAVSTLPEQAKVTVVPFYFGNISDRRAFHMQGGMENHCLYQARGRAAWLAHNDIDEYFEIRLNEDQRGSGDIKEYLAKLPGEVAAVVVRSQYWGDTSDNHSHSLPFPCYIDCRQPGYFEADIRSKWIGRPEKVSLVNPHIVKTKKAFSRVIADPEKELRLNHFKECAPESKSKGQCIWTKDCSPDYAFRERCRSTLASL